VTQPALDRIVLSDRLVTMAGPDADAMQGVAIRDGRIERLVRRDEVDALRGPATEVVDVGERALLPGFIDVHAHAEVACRAAYGTVDCRAPECGSVDEVLQALAAGLPDAAETGWVVGQANLFFDRKLREGRLPTREELDRVSEDVAIALRAGGHITVLNSRALELAGIDRAYRPPEHSITGRPAVERHEDDEPTGVVKEMDNILPLPPQDATVVRDALRSGVRDLFTRYGVTTVGEISETVQGLRTMASLARDRELGTRMRTYLWAPGTMSLEQALDWPRLLDLDDVAEHVGVHGVKLFCDGGYSAKSAAVKQPYLGMGREHFGDIALERDFLLEALPATRDAGLQLAIHANGDRAQEWLCEVIEAAGGSPADPRLRTRIEHAGNFRPDPATSDWWQRAGIVPVPQPVFLYTFGDYFADYLGDYGTEGRFQFADLVADGWLLTGSSDVWVGSEREATNPLFSVWCCLRRQTYDERLIDPEQAVSIDEALRMHTINGAKVLGEEADKGSLEPGKLADLVVLAGDPRTAAIDDLPGIAVDAVYLGGEPVYAGAGAGAWS
jgi:predicted amidohydrolase YtcJ